jgi:hypothetical protein
VQKFGVESCVAKATIVQVSILSSLMEVQTKELGPNSRAPATIPFPTRRQRCCYEVQKKYLQKRPSIFELHDERHANVKAKGEVVTQSDKTIAEVCRAWRFEYAQ